jgi:hypothetical protein
MLEISEHARQRLAERDITVEELEHAHAHPVGEPMPGSGSGTMVIRGTLPAGGYLKVVVAAADPKVIVSAWRED